ncbi:MAG: YcjX family protein [Candidatus Endonucleobacter sp. (ex Gigantidas childressi)]|nr:YcjX family protein [Candidatus Endonucleobacter sp. (ex Gigantidas childressi)]
MVKIASETSTKEGANTNTSQLFNGVSQKIGRKGEGESSRKSLSLIQPGRFLIPGTVKDTEILRFIPLLKSGSYSEGQLATASHNSYFKVCERRYQSYIKDLVEPFYKTFFRRINRQLILVDVVSALNARPE